MKGYAWLALIAGLWVVISTFFGFEHSFFLWSDLITGVILSLAGFAAMKEKPAAGWTGVVVGLWLVLAAFLTGLHQGVGLLWNNVLVGLIVAIAGILVLTTLRPSPKGSF